MGGHVFFEDVQDFPDDIYEYLSALGNRISLVYLIHVSNPYIQILNEVRISHG